VALDDDGSSRPASDGAPLFVSHQRATYVVSYLKGSDSPPRCVQAKLGKG
jgi:hypothetical protein